MYSRMKRAHQTQPTKNTHRAYPGRCPGLRDFAPSGRRYVIPRNTSPEGAKSISIGHRPMHSRMKREHQTRPTKNTHRAYPGRCPGLRDFAPSGRRYIIPRNTRPERAKSLSIGHRPMYSRMKRAHQTQHTPRIKPALLHNPQLRVVQHNFLGAVYGSKINAGNQVVGAAFHGENGAKTEFLVLDLHTY